MCLNVNLSFPHFIAICVSFDRPYYLFRPRPHCVIPSGKLFLLFLVLLSSSSSSRGIREIPPPYPPYLPSSSSPPPPPPASASRHCWEAGRGVNGWIMRLFTVHVNLPNGILKVTAAGRDHSRFRSSSDSSRSGKCVQERSSRRDCTGENCSSVSSEQLSGPLLLPENTDEHEHTVRCISAALLMDLIAAVQPWLMIMSYLYPFMKMILNQGRCGGV